jgi:hypothetical protein
MKRNICRAEVRNHIPQRVTECQMLRNHSIIVIIFSPIDFKKRLSRRDTDERFHLPTAQDEVKNSTKSPMRFVGTTRYGHIDSFGKFEHESTLVCLKPLASLQVRLCPRTSKSLSLGDVLALIKCRFHETTCRVNVWNNHVFTFSTNLVSRFYCLFDFRNLGTKLEDFKG